MAWSHKHTEVYFTDDEANNGCTLGKAFWIKGKLCPEFAEWRLIFLRPLLLARACTQTSNDRCSLSLCVKRHNREVFGCEAGC